MHQSASNRYAPYLTTPLAQVHAVARVRTPSPLSRPQSAGHEDESFVVDAEDMAVQTIKYMDVLEEHAKVFQHYPQAEREQAYQGIVIQEWALPPDTKWPQLTRGGIDVLQHQMEAIIQRPAITIAE